MYPHWTDHPFQSHECAALRPLVYDRLLSNVVVKPGVFATARTANVYVKVGKQLRRIRILLHCQVG